MSVKVREEVGVVFVSYRASQPFLIVEFVTID